MKLTTITNKLAICLLIGFNNNQLNANWVGDIVSGAFGAVGSGITLVGAGLNYGLGAFDPLFNAMDYAMGGFAFPDEVDENVNALATDGAETQVDAGAPPQENPFGMGQPPPGMQMPPHGFPGGQQGPPPGFPGGPQRFPPGMQGPPPQGFPHGQPQRIPPGGQLGPMMRSKKSANVSDSEENSESSDTSESEIEVEIAKKPEATEKAESEIEIVKKPESTKKVEPAADPSEDLGND